MCKPRLKVNSSKNCIICSAQVIISSEETGSRSQLITNEVSQRFCTLAGRYLNFSFKDVPTPPISLKGTLHRNVSRVSVSQGIGLEDKTEFLESHTVCDDCCSIAGSFCDTFQDISRLQLQLNWRIQEISELMKRAEEIQNRDQLGIKDLSGGLFRQEFLTCVQRNSRDFPHVSLDRADCERKLKSAEISKVQSKSQQVTQSKDEIEVIDIDINISTPINAQPKPHKPQIHVQEVKGKANSSFQSPVPMRPFKCGICHARFTKWTSCKFHQVAIHKTKNAIVIKMSKRDPGSGPVTATTTTTGSRSGLRKIPGGNGGGPMTTTSVTPTTTTPVRETEPLTETKSNAPARRPSSQPVSQNVKANRRPIPARKCRYCPNKFQLFALLYRHEKSHAEWTPLECRFCGKHFACKEFLVAHEKFHSYTKAKTSSKKNANVPSVNVNANSSQTQNSSNSDDIDNFISSLINNHDRNAPVTMPKSTSTRKRTNDAMTFSQPINKSHKCKFCHRTFINFNGLRIHEKKMHTGEISYKCVICRKTFSDWSNCSAHQKAAHNMAKALVISELHRPTTSNGFQGGQRNQNENQHQIIQRVSKPREPGAPKLYHCKVCGRGFNFVQSVYRHQRNVHGLTQEVIADFRKWKPQPPAVGHCPQAAAAAATVPRPKVTPVSKATPVPVRKAIPVPARVLTRHQIALLQNRNQIATFKCRFCGKLCRGQLELQRHEVLHTPMKSFLCKICGKAFHLKSDLIQHERIHSNHPAANDNDDGVEIIELG